jgi:hypothetical protein
MKIAFCFYGQPRLFRKGFENIREFCRLNSDHEFDFFFHTWYDEIFVGKYYECSKFRNINPSELLIEKNLKEEIINLYSPKSYLFESPKIFDLESIKKSKLYELSNERVKLSIQNTLSNVYSKYTVSNILENFCNSYNIKYDLVISIRFDFLNKLDFIISKDINLNTINCVYCIDNLHRIYVNDCIVVSNYINYIYYSKAYINIEKIINNEKFINYLKEIGCGNDFCPETIMTSNLFFYYDDIKKIIYYNKSLKNFI